MADYDYANRAEFILSGFTFEPDDDGSCRLVSKAPMKDGNPDWQAFRTFSDMVIWLAAGVDEIRSAALVADIYTKHAARQATGR